jgi:hypothetical protein
MCVHSRVSISSGSVVIQIVQVNVQRKKNSVGIRVKMMHVKCLLYLDNYFGVI